MSVPLDCATRSTSKDKFMLKISFWIVFFAMAGAAFAAPSDGVVRVTAEWDMSLDANGAVTALEARPGRIKDVLLNTLETAVNSWSFSPGSINGKPAATDTSLWVSISLWPSPDGESYSVKVDKVSTGGGIAKISKMPHFPRNQVHKARRNKTNPVVVLEVTYDELGKPSKILVAKGSPIKTGLLVSGAIKAVLTWTFKPELVAGHGVEARVLLPFCYAAVSNALGESNCSFPSDTGDTSFEPGSSIALESSVSLKSDVIGKTL